MRNETFDCGAPSQAEVSAATSAAGALGKGGRLMGKPGETGFSLAAQKHWSEQSVAAWHSAIIAEQ